MANLDGFVPFDFFTEGGAHASVTNKGITFNKATVKKMESENNDNKRDDS